MALDETNRRHGTSFRVAGSYAGGETGATRLVDAAGRAFVLKYENAGLAAATTARLREVGYPAPRYVVVGDGYSVQEELPGSPLANWAALDETVVARIVELNELQSGRAVARFGWRTWLGRLAASGARSYFVLDTLRRHSDRSRVLLERCQETTRRYLDEVPEARDVVHWDFSPDNVLAVGGAVTGVIDWDGTRGGDRLFDLATIVYYAPPAAAVREYVVERIGERPLAVYLAHLCLRQAEWSLRRHDAETGEWMLAYALSVAAAAP